MGRGVRRAGGTGPLRGAAAPERRNARRHRKRLQRRACAPLPLHTRRSGQRLFPAPDWANPCKHVAAVYYLLGERFDADPFLLFTLRGRTKEQVAAELRKRRAVGAPVGEELTPYAPAAASPPRRSPGGKRRTTGARRRRWRVSACRLQEAAGRVGASQARGAARFHRAGVLPRPIGTQLIPPSLRKALAAALLNRSREGHDRPRAAPRE